jgi:hypothetical protein
MSTPKKAKVTPNILKSIGPANNLADAYNAILSDLEDPNLFNAYYVNRPDSPIEEIKNRIILSQTPVKILFAGQPRSGKTTELFRLIKELEDRCFIVYYSVYRDMEAADLKYEDLLLLSAIKLSEEAIERKIKIDKDVIKLLTDWFVQISSEVVETKIKEKKRELDLGAKLKFMVAKLGGGFKTSSEVRTEIRNKLEPKVGEIIEKIDILSANIKNETHKDPLLIIDDLEKVDLKVAKDIFFGHAQTLGKPNLKIIFLFSKSMTYTNEGRLVASQLSSPIHIPNIMTTNREDGPYNPGLQLLKQIILKRLEQYLFEDDAFDYLFKTSNGVLSDLFSIIAGASITAISKGRNRITWDDVDFQFKLLTDQFRRAIREEYYPTLAQVHNEKRTDNNEHLWDMLHILAVLEYRDEKGIYYDVHPAVVPLLQEKKLKHTL